MPELSTAPDPQISDRQEETALTPSPKKPEPMSYGLAGIAPKTFVEAWRFAQAIAASDLAPKDYKGKPENCLIAMQMGAELGLTAMSAIQNIAVINGRPCLFGDSLLAVVMNHPQYEYHKEYCEGSGDQKTAIFEVKRKGHALHVERFSVADAKIAGLWGKSGPWTNYPDRMMQMRARGFGCRNKFPDALRGMIIAEEAQDIPVGPTIEASAEPQEVVDQNAALRQEITAFFKEQLQVDGEGKRYNDARLTVLLAGKDAAALQALYDAGKAELVKRQADPPEPPKPVPLVRAADLDDEDYQREKAEAQAQANYSGKPVRLGHERWPVTLHPGGVINPTYAEHAAAYIERIKEAARYGKLDSASVAVVNMEHGELPGKPSPKATEKPLCAACERLKAKCFDCVQRERNERIQFFKALVEELKRVLGKEPEGPPTLVRFEGLGRAAQEEEIRKAQEYLEAVSRNREEQPPTLFGGS